MWCSKIYDHCILLNVNNNISETHSCASTMILLIAVMGSLVGALPSVWVRYVWYCACLYSYVDIVCLNFILFLKRNKKNTHKLKLFQHIPFLKMLFDHLMGFSSIADTHIFLIILIYVCFRHRLFSITRISVWTRRIVFGRFAFVWRCVQRLSIVPFTYMPQIYCSKFFVYFNRKCARTHIFHILLIFPSFQ